MRDYKLLRFLKIVTLTVLGAALLTFAVMSLWNWLIPALFSGPQITFFQAGGLLILSKILFSGFGHHCHHHSERKEYWKNRFKEKMSSMTPEERERIRSEFRSKCFGDFKRNEKFSEQKE